MVADKAPKPTKAQRRDAAREKARELREAQKRKEKRTRLYLQGGILVGVLAVIGIVVLVLSTSVKSTGDSPANMIGDAVVIGEGGTAVKSAAVAASASPTPYTPEQGDVNVSIYLDYMCSHCGEFEEVNGDQLNQLVEDGSITLELHPVGIVDAVYSPAAQAAAACVANYQPDSFLDWNTAMFADQQQRDTKALQELTTQVVGEANAEEINSCISKGTFKGWANAANERQVNQTIPGTETEMQGTPTIVINGAVLTGDWTDPSYLINAIQSAEATANAGSDTTKAE